MPEQVGGLLATVMQDQLPHATIGVAATESDAEVMWPALEFFADLFADGVMRPQAPWVAAVVLAPMNPAMLWLGDFERCLAWAHVEQKQRGAPG